MPNPFPVPGVKLGLANIITLLTLVLFEFKTALTVTLLRAVLGSLLSGTLFGFGFLLSVSGALSATCLMALFLRFLPAFSLIGVSVIGAIAHNLGQLSMAALLMSYSGIFYYLPVMMLFSLPTGLLIGILAKKLVAFLQSSGRFDAYFRNEYE